MAYHYSIYDMLLDDYGVDMKTYDPCDCTTWYLGSTAAAQAQVVRKPPLEFNDNRDFMDSEMRALYDDLIAMGFVYGVDFTVGIDGKICLNV